MRRSASEIIRNLESRIARLEKFASSEKVDAGTTLKLKVEIEGKTESKSGMVKSEYYHFLPGTILYIDYVNSYAGGISFQIKKLREGIRNEFTKPRFYKTFELKVDDAWENRNLGHIIENKGQRSASYYADLNNVKIISHK
jgi:hypothetical protein